ncbi:MAG: hypothetical protein ABIO78_00925 [Thermoanaerobaculia bacterium]
MARKDLLPGVGEETSPPTVTADTRRAITRARRQAVVRDIANMVFLLALDYFFMRWPSTHIPAMSRHSSAMVLLVLNAMVVTYVVIARLKPRMRARRIAATWSLRERSRFFQRP